VRIIAGVAKGRELKSPLSDGVRPTSDRAREGLFSTLESEFGSIDGLRFLDLFAGSGAVGVEALSRGATEVHSVEYEIQTAEIARAYFELVNGAGLHHVFRESAEKFLESGPARSGEGGYDIIFMDPPYDVPNAVIERLLAFTRGEIDVLVSTTVIEVGVDVPNATMMVIMDADRFGVSQLHQLRGRVGRGGAQGLCLLISSSPSDSPAMERLTAVASTTDGFALAQIDLEHRSEGDVLGSIQSGRKSHLRLLRVLEHENLISDARREAADLISRDGDLNKYPLLAQEIDIVMAREESRFMEKG